MRHSKNQRKGWPVQTQSSQGWGELCTAALEVGVLQTRSFCLYHGSTLCLLLI